MLNTLPEKLQLHGEEGYIKFHNDHPYLFRCGNLDSGLFHGFERALVELNDFCFVLQEGLKHYSYHQKLEIDIDPVNFETEEVAKEAEYFSDVLSSMDYDPTLVGKFYFPASTLTLLYFQTISFLKDIASVVTRGKPDYTYKKIAKNLAQQNDGNSQPEIIILIELIEKGMGVKTHVFLDAEIKILVRDRLKKVRNEYAHGDWKVLEKTLKGVNLVLAFKVVSKMLKQLEVLYLEWEGKQSSPEALQKFIKG
ncbi:hypothetical protein OAA86_08460 [Rhodospirillales bacterium]|nr:hypothetical protein [Rhodospirillales bacterium]